MADLGEYPVVTERSVGFLNPRQLKDYRAEREACLRWLLTYGKRPKAAEGYAPGTVKPRAARLDRFYRFVWRQEDGYTSNLSHDHADDWRDHLAQRFEKPKSQVSPDDWDRANDWMIPSLVFTSLDAGFRPVEVERSSMSWVDTENAVLRIPKEDSAKNRDHWVVGLREKTADYLARWREHRATYPKYEDRDAIWLTRKNNPYNISSLRDLLHRLCDIAGIETANRQMSWCTIRHSVGTYMTREEDLAAAQAQLRHKFPGDHDEVRPDTR